MSLCEYNNKNGVHIYAIYVVTLFEKLEFHSSTIYYFVIK